MTIMNEIVRLYADHVKKGVTPEILYLGQNTRIELAEELHAHGCEFIMRDDNIVFSNMVVVIVSERSWMKIGIDLDKLTS